MNFLAHFYLAQPTSASRVGNFLGDFVTGTPESLQGQWAPEVLEGIIMHRRVDAFTDRHPAFIAAKQYIAPERRRFAGIILDMFIDHFLAQSWEVLNPQQSLPSFTTEVARALWEYEPMLPPAAQRTAAAMISQEWLLRYRTVEGLQISLTGLSRRRERFGPIAESSLDLRRHYADLRPLCLQVLAEAKEQAG